MRTMCYFDSDVAITVPDYLKPYVDAPIDTEAFSLDPLQIIKADTLGSYFKQEFIYETAKIIARQAQNQLERSCKAYIENEVKKELAAIANAVNQKSSSANESV